MHLAYKQHMFRRVFGRYFIQISKPIPVYNSPFPPLFSVLVCVLLRDDNAQLFSTILHCLCVNCIMFYKSVQLICKHSGGCLKLWKVPVLWKKFISMTQLFLSLVFFCIFFGKARSGQHKNKKILESDIKTRSQAKLIISLLEQFIAYLFRYVRTNTRMECMIERVHALISSDRGLNIWWWRFLLLLFLLFPPVHMEIRVFSSLFYVRFFLSSVIDFHIFDWLLFAF